MAFAAKEPEVIHYNEEISVRNKRFGLGLGAAHLKQQQAVCQTIMTLK